MFDLSKIKKFDLADLAGRTLYIQNTYDGKIPEVRTMITIAFDVDTGESFVIGVRKFIPDGYIEPEMEKAADEAWKKMMLK